MGKKARSPEEAEKQQKKDQFIAAVLMEFPKATLSKVSMEWKRRGNRSKISSEEYEIAKNVVYARLEGNQMGIDSWYGQRNLEKARERRLRREALAKESSMLAKKYPIGKTVGVTELKKLFDEHFADVLGATLKPVTAKGRSLKFKVAKRLPTKADYEIRRTQHFRLTVSQLVSQIREVVSEGVDSLSAKLDEMSDRARDGERGMDIGMALEHLESAFSDLEEHLIPQTVRHLTVCWVPQANGRRSPKKTETAVSQIQFLKTQVETRFTKSVVDAADLIEHSFSTKTSKDLASDLRETPKHLLEFASVLGEAAESIDEAIDHARSSLN